MIQVKFGDISANKEFITTSTAQQPLSIEWTAGTDMLTTVIVYDMDSPQTAPNNVNSPFLHLLVTNIKGIDINNGDSLIEYMTPYPPHDSLPHTYYVDIYTQSTTIRPVAHKIRKKFNIDKFVSDHNLQLLDRESFKVGSIVPTATTLAQSSSVPTSITPVIYKPNERKSTTDNFFLSGSDLPEDKRKFCRCTLKVADKQRGGCNIDRSWFKTIKGKKCYNPYSICAKSVGTTSRECGKNYDFESFSDNHLITYGQLHQKDKEGIIIHIPDPYNRQTMLDNIKRWKELKEK